MTGPNAFPLPGYINIQINNIADNQNRRAQKFDRIIDETMEFTCEILPKQVHVELQSSQPKIPRPANAFMLYANENRKKMARAFPLDSNKEISKRLGRGWKELDQERKSFYYAMAKKVDAEHKIKYPDYTYNPKEARIRKAMRDANRERAMGVAPATRGGRRSQPWVHPETDDHFMMTPSHGMRGVVGSPMCGTGFPIGNVGNGQFIQPMHSYNKHMHLISHDNNGYLQPNPMAQLQHQTDMWNQYQHSPNPMRPTPTEYVMPNSQMPNYHHQQATEMHQTNEASSSIERVKIGPETFTELNSTATSPHTNENVPPNHNNFEGKIEPLMESSNVSQSPFMNLYQENVSAHSHFDKNEKVKKHSPNNIAKPQKSLPDFNEAFGSTERGRFQSPPDPRLPPKQGYLDFFITNNDLKFDDYHI